MKQFLPKILFAAITLGAFSAYADAISIGVNAGVSTRETSAMVREKYKPLASRFTKRLREPVEIVPVRSSEVTERLKKSELDALIVHTHAAITEAQKNGWHLRAVSNDVSNNQVHFLVAKSVSGSTLADINVKSIVFPGARSFATVAARAESASRGASLSDYTQLVTQYQDSLPFYLNSGLASIGVTRLASVAEEWKRNGGRVLHSSAALPVYALLVNAKLSKEKADRLVQQIVELDDEEFTKASGIRNFVPVEATLEILLTSFFALAQASVTK